MTRVGAAHLAGIGETTLWEWMCKGRDAVDPESEYAKFRAAVLKAEATAELKLVADVRRDDPKWLLSRRYTRWREKPVEAKLTHQGPDGKPLQALSDETLSKLLEALGVKG